MAFRKLRAWFRSRFSRKKAEKGGGGGNFSLFCCTKCTIDDDGNEEKEDDGNEEKEDDGNEEKEDDRQSIDIKSNLCNNSQTSSSSPKKHAKQDLHKSKCFLRNLTLCERTEVFCPCPIKEIDEMQIQQFPNCQKKRRKFCRKSVDTKYIEEKMATLSLLGAGGFGCVYLIRDTERGIHLAAKVIPVKSSSDEMISNEIKILKKIKSNPLCVQFDSDVKYEVSPDVQKHFLFVKYFPSCTLWHFPREYWITEDAIHFILGQIGIALKYLHGVKIIHRDIKGDNILINDMCQIKLIDFGLSAIGTSFKGYCGTLYHEAPEVLIHSLDKNAKAYSFAADYYSLGICAFQLTYGIFPCEHKLKLIGLNDKDSVGKKHALREIASGFVDYPADLNQCRQDLIRKLLIPDPEQRLGDKTYLSHSFFKNKVLKQLLKCGLKVEKKSPLNEPGKTNIPVVEGKDKLDNAVPSLTNEKLI